MKPEQYAEWVFNYKEFWSKCMFETWKERLYMLGMSYSFWDKYKELKGRYKENEEED